MAEMDTLQEIQLQPGKCQFVIGEGDHRHQCMQDIGSTWTYCLFHDPNRQELAHAARVKGGLLGGRKRKYVKGTSVPIESLTDVLKGLGETIANLKEMDATVPVCNSLINAYRVASACFQEQQDRELILEQIEQLEKAIEAHS